MFTLFSCLKGNLQLSKQYIHLANVHEAKKDRSPQRNGYKVHSDWIMNLATQGMHKIEVSF